MTMRPPAEQPRDALRAIEKQQEEPEDEEEGERKEPVTDSSHRRHCGTRAHAGPPGALPGARA